MKTADKYLILSITVLLMFTVATMVFDYCGMNVQEPLIVGMFGFFGTEIAACCVIKVINVHHERDNDVDGSTD